MSVLRPSLRWKIALPAILTTAATVVSFARYTVDQTLRSMDEREQNQLITVAEMLARDSGTIVAVATGEGQLARQSVEEILELTPSIVRIELYRETEDGELHELLQSGSVGLRMLKAWGDMAQSGVKKWETEFARGYIVATPIWVDARDVVAADLDSYVVDRNRPSATLPQRSGGTLIVWASREPIVRSVTEFVRAVMPFGLALLLLAMILGVAITTGMLRHLRGLADAATSIGQGLRGVQLPVRGNDEIATLADSFNKMSNELEVQRERIEEQNRTLEQKVAARTRELVRAYEELQTLDRAKDSFLSSVSHELRTPLTSIRSFAEILLEYGDEEEPELRREFLTIIKDESERLSRLINQVLDLAKIEAGVMTWQMSNFDFRDLVETAVKALAGLKHNKLVDFEVDVPESEVRFYGDRDRLHQVITNLLTNAWKFSPEGEAIGVTLKQVDGGIELRVADRGAGIDGDEEKERVFDRFRQGAHSLTDKPEGTGLGLPISKEIVCMHGGFIACEDNPGGGAVFLFLLPESDPQYPRPIDEAVADDSGIWKDLNDPRHASIFDSSWNFAART